MVLATRKLDPYYTISIMDGAPAPKSLPNEPGWPAELVLRKGSGFGDGRHETTQLCLLALGYLLRSQCCPQRMLDFGAGNGVLGIAAALRGARVESVEIDATALAEAKVNAELNGVLDRFEFRTSMSTPPQHFDVVVANILKRVLLDYAEAITTRVAQHGFLVLSGLTSTDVPEILGKYRPLLPNHRDAIYERGTWRAVLFQPEANTGHDPRQCPDAAAPDTVNALTETSDANRLP
jgi:ribosomal protein L11 methyltransferase